MGRYIILSLFINFSNTTKKEIAYVTKTALTTSPKKINKRPNYVHNLKSLTSALLGRSVGSLT